MEKRDIWLLWQLEDGAAILLAVDESEATVLAHQRMIKQEREEMSALPLKMFIEKRETNHLYGNRGL